MLKINLTSCTFKAWITNAHQAEGIVAFATTDKSKKHKGRNGGHNSTAARAKIKNVSLAINRLRKYVISDLNMLVDKLFWLEFL